MKTLTACKRTVSLLLSVIILMSMMTVGIVAASAANTDAAPVSATTTYYVAGTMNNWNTSGEKMTQATDVNGSTIYYAGPYSQQHEFKITDGSKYLYGQEIKTKDLYDNSLEVSESGPTGNCWPAPASSYYIVLTISTNGNAISCVTALPISGSTTPTQTPTEEEPGETIRIYFYDNTNGWINDSDANIFARPSGSQQTVKMTETVDITNGHKVWYADVKDAGSYYFYRCSYYFDTTNAQNTAWNTWNATGRGSNITYMATSSGSGRWSSNNPTIADPTDITKFTYGVWVDAKGAGNVLDAVSWYKKGNNNYDLYLPSYTNLSDVQMYTSISGLSINSTSLSTEGPTSVTLEAGRTYTLSKGANLTVYKSDSTAALMLTTNEPLWTGKLNDLNNKKAWPGGNEPDGGWVSAYKEAIATKGSYLFYNESGTQVNTNTELKKLKGRGNSSFEASMMIYGKYAYNITTKGKEKLIDGCEKSSKWCLLANNVDVTMMRNTVIYGIADAIGVKYSSNTRFIDLFDNGNYLGAYVIIEKVEYGPNTLMPDMVNLDKINEAIKNEAGEAVNFDNITATTENSYTPSGSSTSYQCKYYDVTQNGFSEPEYENANFLLEHELFNRYEAELSWFVSGRTGQAVVVKYPEYCTKGEMHWIIDQYEKMESAVYDNNGDYNKIAAAIDTTSFAKMYLIQELTNNLDSGATSFYIYNDLNSGKLCAAPVWDYDWSLGGYSGKKFVKDGFTSQNLAKPDYMFVRNKSLKTDGDYPNGKNLDYNLQAKLTKNTTYFNLCKSVYTNQLLPQLEKYVKSNSSDTGIIIDELLPKFSSSMVMDNARWNSFESTDDWGSKVTTDYNPWSYDFKVDNRNSSGSSQPKSYSNAVYYLNDWLQKRTEAMSDSNNGNLYDANLKYTISDAKFTSTQSGNQLTVTASATATKGGSALGASGLKYDVYLDGQVAASGVAATESTTITLVTGTNPVYIVVYPADYPELKSKSSSKVFQYSDGVTYVDATIAFKSSSSYRYIPKVYVNGAEAEPMTQGECIGNNSSFTQKYYWYTVGVRLVQGQNNTLRFTNALSMSATVSVNVTAQPTGTLYFGVNNLNNGTTAVDLTAKELAIRNFVKSATCMLNNDPKSSGVATTSLDGTIYKMGDTDGDNSLTIMDVTKTQRALAEIDTLSQTGTALADYDLNGDVSIFDCTTVQIYLANNP